MRSHNKKKEELPEDIRVSRGGEDAGFMRKMSLGPYFMTIHDMDLDGFGSAGPCREYTSLRSDENSTPKVRIR